MRGKEWDDNRPLRRGWLNQDADAYRVSRAPLTQRASVWLDIIWQQYHNPKTLSMLKIILQYAPKQKDQNNDTNHNTKQYDLKMST